MEKSLRDCEIYDGDIRPYVERNLRDRFPASTVNEIPIVSSVNIARKIVDSKASLYKNEPLREFTDLSDDQAEVVEKVYSKGMANAQMMYANKYFELQKQTHLKIIPKKGKITFKPLKLHQINAVPSDEDPEEAAIYIISSFDKWDSHLRESTSDNNNEVIAERDDYKDKAQTFIVWSSSYHFVMDSDGNVLSEEIENPIAPLIPIIEVAPPNKDFKYFLEGNSELSLFTVEHNERESMLAQIVELQGFAQAFLKAPKDLQPQTINIGPNRILRLITDPDNPQADSEFGFASPSSDIANSRANNDAILAQFLSTQGLDPSVISTSSANGGRVFGTVGERLLAMIDKFESSKDAQDIFKYAEHQMYKIIKAWLNTLRGTEDLDEEYWTSEIPEDSKLIFEFKRPEVVETPESQREDLQFRLDNSLASREMILEKLDGVEEDDAIETIRSVDGRDPGTEA